MPPKVCESDFATGLAMEEQEEADAASEYEKVTQENKDTILYYAMLCYAMLYHNILCYAILYYTMLYHKVAKATKEQDVKYKTQEDKSQEKTIQRNTITYEGSQTKSYKWK